MGNGWVTQQTNPPRSESQLSLIEARKARSDPKRAAGLYLVFAEFEREILRDRVKAGIAQARKQGKPHGRPPTVKACSDP